MSINSSYVGVKELKNKILAFGNLKKGKLPVITGSLLFLLDYLFLRYFNASVGDLPVIFLNTLEK